jgi:hypothetical protein
MALLYVFVIANPQGEAIRRPVCSRIVSSFGFMMMVFVFVVATALFLHFT